MSTEIKITEVRARRGRRWVYGQLDPARPVEIKPLTVGYWDTVSYFDLLKCVDPSIDERGIAVVICNGNGRREITAAEYRAQGIIT